MSTTQRRKNQRVTFSRAFKTYIMGIDRTWRRDCLMHDVSESGAKLTVEGSLEGLVMKEFLLLLTSTGSVHRYCETAWINGNQLGVRFITSKPSAPQVKGKAANKYTAEV
ncbi:PilZ domain-containing protein [Bradyrhizobium sp.]|jgi:hypothetical protein|uniref:PilZ domain-containing protein n=1 Tax=Bradyrhizobium sp. TaxID=376 RepID=UPI003C72300D